MDYRDYNGPKKPNGNNGYKKPAFDDGYKMPIGSSEFRSQSAANRKPSDSGGYKRPIPSSAPKKSSTSNGYKKPANPDANYNRPSAKPGSSKRSNKNSGIIKALLAVFCVLIAGIIAIGVYFVVRWKDNDYSSLKSASLVMLSPDETKAPAQQNTTAESSAKPTATQNNASTIVYNGDTYIKNENVVNLLFLGLDSNSERKQQQMGYRSDMIMVCAVDIDKKKVTLISIPRDTKTTMYKVDSKGKVTDTIQNKINAAFSLGGEDFKVRAANTMSCVQMFLERRCELEQPLDFQLDIPVYLYAGIDMDGITEVASAVGGVEVTLTETVPEVGDKGDTVTLKHQNAIEFLTNRHDTDGDTHRAARQQQFMIALAKKIKSMGPVDMILSLYDELQKYVFTNLTTDQMIDFAKVLTKTDIDSIDMEMITGEGETVNGTYYMVHDEDATLQLLLNVYYTKAS